VILYQGSNQIQFVYGDLIGGQPGRAFGNSATVGFENADGSAGFEFGFNTLGTVAPGKSMVFAFNGTNYERVR
jgi:hypothetical protein